MVYCTYVSWESTLVLLSTYTIHPTSLRLKAYQNGCIDSVERVPETGDEKALSYRAFVGTHLSEKAVKLDLLHTVTL